MASDAQCVAELEGKLADREKTLEFARGFAKDLAGQVRELKEKLSRAEMALHIAEEDAGNALGRCAELQTQVTGLEGKLSARVTTAERQLEELRLASLPGPYVGGFE